MGKYFYAAGSNLWRSSVCTTRHTMTNEGTSRPPLITTIARDNARRRTDCDAPLSRQRPNERRGQKQKSTSKRRHHESAAPKASTSRETDRRTRLLLGIYVTRVFVRMPTPTCFAVCAPRRRWWYSHSDTKTRTHRLIALPRRCRRERWRQSFSPAGTRRQNKNEE